MFVHLIAYLWFAQQVMITRVTAALQKAAPEFSK
jgi:hypothetical protein